MRILYVSQYFPPEVNAPAQRVMDFAKAWTEAGHEVIVVTGFPNHPAGVVYDGYKLRLRQREVIDGIEVLRTYLYPAANKGVARRCINYFSFMASAATFGASAAGNVDVVIASSPQLLVGVAGWAISAAKRAPFVLEVRDVWPEALAAVDAKVNPVFFKLLARIAKFLYKRAGRIVTVTEGARDIIRNHGVSGDKLVLIPSGIRTDLIKPMQPPVGIRERFGGPNSILVSYVGTHGMAQGLSTVLEAAHKLSGDTRIHFVLIGDGAEKEDLLKQKEHMGLGHVHFLDQMPQSEVLNYVAASDICLVPLRKADLFKQTIPSKVYELMACARPIVLGVDGEARELVETAESGVYVEPENSSALADAVVRLADNPQTRETYGANGRRFILENYDKNLLAKTYLDMLAKLTGSPRCHMSEK